MALDAERQPFDELLVEELFQVAGAAVYLGVLLRKGDSVSLRGRKAGFGDTHSINSVNVVEQQSHIGDERIDVLVPIRVDRIHFRADDV